MGRRGCLFCNSKLDAKGEKDYEDNIFFISDGKMMYSTYISDAGGSLWDSVNIQYCPMCGCKVGGK